MLTLGFPPPGKAATPWEPGKEHRGRQQRAQPCAPHRTKSRTPAASRTPKLKQPAARPLPARRRHNVRYAWAAFSGFRVMPHYVE
ncbi:hypothetical protein RC97_18745 [Pectobacterium brasiliense]|nr:hypothetical protein RC97_18745 [Pectobacterium brasiliense]